MNVSPLAIFTAGLGRVQASLTPLAAAMITGRHPNDRYDGLPQQTHLETLKHIWTPRARRRVRSLLNMDSTRPVTLEDAEVAVERATANERTFRRTEKKK
jgi:hypothetical protein